MHSVAFSHHYKIVASEKKESVQASVPIRHFVLVPPCLEGVCVLKE